MNAKSEQPFRIKNTDAPGADSPEDIVAATFHDAKTIVRTVM
jgi:hypothetical protein